MTTVNIPLTITVSPTQVTVVVGASTTTIAVPAAPVTPVPPITASWAGIVADANGNLDPFWGGSPPGAVSPAGNWNSQMSIFPNATAPDGSKAVLLEPTGPWPIWIAHPAAFAGNPSQNGIAINLAGYTHWQADIYPVSPNIALTLAANQVAGLNTYIGPNAATTDIPAGSFSIPNKLPAGVFTTVSVPLSSVGVPVTGNTAPMWIYKFMLQQNLNPGMNMYIRNVKFV
jgi:hypothetical protein